MKELTLFEKAVAMFKKVYKNTEYEEYRKKYEDKIKILKKGNKYAIQYKKPYSGNSPIYRFLEAELIYTTPFKYSLKEAEKFYIDKSKEFDFDSLPIKEI